MAKDPLHFSRRSRPGVSWVLVLKVKCRKVSERGAVFLWGIALVAAAAPAFGLFEPLRNVRDLDDGNLLRCR
jgi:hypothetical protein